MKLADIIKSYLINSKATTEEQAKLNRIPFKGSIKPALSSIPSIPSILAAENEQLSMPTRLTPEQIKYNVNMKLYGRPTK